MGFINYTIDTIAEQFKHGKYQLCFSNIHDLNKWLHDCIGNVNLINVENISSKFTCIFETEEIQNSNSNMVLLGNSLFIYKNEGYIKFINKDKEDNYTVEVTNENRLNSDVCLWLESRKYPSTFVAPEYTLSVVNVLEDYLNTHPVSVKFNDIKHVKNWLHALTCSTKYIPFYHEYEFITDQNENNLSPFIQRISSEKRTYTYSVFKVPFLLYYTLVNNGIFI